MKQFTRKLRLYLQLLNSYNEHGHFKFPIRAPRARGNLHIRHVLARITSFFREQVPQSVFKFNIAQSSLRLLVN